MILSFSCLTQLYHYLSCIFTLYLIQSVARTPCVIHDSYDVAPLRPSYVIYKSYDVALLQPSYVMHESYDVAPL